MASNNFYLNNDPLLFNSQSPDNRQFIEFDRLRQQQSQYDYLSELDNLTRGNSSISQQLSENVEYTRLSAELQTIIQNELMSSIRWRINSNPSAVKNMQRQIDIINNVKAETEEQQRRNIDEINDYIKNHSDITFDEYRKQKSDNEKQTKKK